MSAQEQTDLSWECVDGYWYGYWDWAWDPCAWLAPVYEDYIGGAVIAGLADPEAEQVVFGGVIQGALDDPDDADEAIDQGVEEVFDQYPENQTGSD